MEAAAEERRAMGSLRSFGRRVSRIDSFLRLIIINLPGAHFILISSPNDDSTFNSKWTSSVTPLRTSYCTTSETPAFGQGS